VKFWFEHIENLTALKQHGIVLRILLRPYANSTTNMMHVCDTFNAVLDEFGGKPIKSLDLLEILGCPQIKRMLKRYRRKTFQRNSFSSRNHFCTRHLNTPSKDVEHLC